MQLKKILRYFIYAAVLFGFLMVSQHIVEEFQNMASLTYNAYPFIYASLCCSVFIGLLIGVDVLWKETKKQGKWMVDAEKLIFLGLPSLYFTLKGFMLLPAFAPVFLPPFLLPVKPETATIFALILGYSFSTSFYKKDL